MVHDETSAPAKPKPSEPSALSLVEARFPQRPGLTRRIHPVFQNHYRVNFHNIDQGNTVAASHFVSVHGGAVEEMN
jgi:hypothetical protein